jgi:AcrR family transcriptional regulator
VLQAATAMLSAGGEEALQMKELAQRAEVALATLYRYFPSKDHVLIGIAVSRYETALRRVTSEAARGESARERVTDFLLREFRAEQRQQKLTAALVRALHETSRVHAEQLERFQQLHLLMLEHVAGDGGPISESQRRILPIVGYVFASATRLWMAGVFSAADARFHIRTGCRLLDLPDETVAEDLARSARMAV